MGVYGEALQLHAVYKKPYFLLWVTRESDQYCKSHENPYLVLQVTCAVSERAIKSKGSYDKIITIAPSYTRKNITHLLPLALLFVLYTRNNTDSNKLVYFQYSFVLWWYLALVAQAIWQLLIFFFTFITPTETSQCLYCLLVTQALLKMVWCP